MKSVFFYGLFMDSALLREKGIQPGKPILGYINNVGLRIGERATLVKSDDEQAFGVIMQLDDYDLALLYSEKSVTDYIPQTARAMTLNDKPIDVVTYNLPAEKLAGENKEYAVALVKVAQKVGLPAHYIKIIEQFSE